MKGYTGGKRILATGSLVAVPGEEAVLEGEDGYTLTICWCEEGVTPRGGRNAMVLELPLEQGPDRIFMGYGLSDDYGTTDVRFVVDRVCDTLRLISFTAYAGPPEE
jgi:hypothetical protein